MRALYRSMRGTPRSWPRISLRAASEAPSDTAAAATHDMVILSFPLLRASSLKMVVRIRADGTGGYNITNIGFDCRVIFRT